MKRQEQSSQTQTDKTVIKLLQGRDGRDGREGVQGIKGDVGQRGEKGDQGKTGQKGEPAGGVVYVRWGHDSCPSTEHNLSTLEELEDHVIIRKEVVLIHSVCH